MPKKVLLVDDSRAMRDYVSAILESTGIYDVVEAPNGFSALQELAKQSFHLIVTDVNMPGVSGIEMTRFVRKTPRYRNIPLLVISTEGAEVDVKRALGAGADAFVRKPFSAQSLLQAIEQVYSKQKEGAL